MRVAIIVCGQMRNIDLCVKTWYEYLFQHYKHADIFVATQDANAFKGRIYTEPIVVNQYIFHPINYDIEKKFVCLFGARVKGIYVRRGMYQTYASHQRSDLILDNSLGWAENFLDMKYALELAGDRYDLYIKIRPDICLCRPFFKIDKIKPNSFYVNDKRERFLWDAVFAMDKQMAQAMKGFYDHYVQVSKESLDKCFDGWNHRHNAEEVLLHFVKSKKAEIINMGEVGYPITWLIGDIKNNLYWSKRHLNFNEKWRNIIINYTNKHIPCTFDFCAANPKLPRLPNASGAIMAAAPYKVALLVCGQLRDFEVCLPSVIENILPYYQCHVFVVTQDANSLKPRLGKGLVNQYIITRVCSQEIKLRNLFGTTLKNIKVRNTFQELTNNQTEQLIMKKKYGWSEHFLDVQTAIEIATAYDTYDFYIKVRPDVLFTKPLILTHAPIPNTLYTLNYTSNTCAETVYVMDHQMAITMRGFYDWYCKQCSIDEWQPSFATEIKLHEFLQLNRTRLMRLKTDAFPMSWLISDIMNQEKKPRHKTLPAAWSEVVESYAKNFKQTIFDLHTPELV